MSEASSSKGSADLPLMENAGDNDSAFAQLHRTLKMKEQDLESTEKKLLDLKKRYRDESKQWTNEKKTLEDDKDDLDEKFSLLRAEFIRKSEQAAVLQKDKETLIADKATLVDEKSRLAEQVESQNNANQKLQLQLNTANDQAEKAKTENEQAIKKKEEQISTVMREQQKLQEKYDAEVADRKLDLIKAAEVMKEEINKQLAEIRNWEDLLLAEKQVVTSLTTEKDDLKTKLDTSENELATAKQATTDVQCLLDEEKIARQGDEAAHAEAINQMNVQITKLNAEWKEKLEKLEREASDDKKSLQVAFDLEKNQMTNEKKAVEDKIMLMEEEAQNKLKDWKDARQKMIEENDAEKKAKAVVQAKLDRLQYKYSIIGAFIGTASDVGGSDVAGMTHGITVGMAGSQMSMPFIATMLAKLQQGPCHDGQSAPKQNQLTVGLIGNTQAPKDMTRLPSLHRALSGQSTSHSSNASQGIRKRTGTATEETADRETKRRSCEGAPRPKK